MLLVMTGMAKSDLLDLSELDYLKMEEALASTARGRAFLRMRDRRTRVLSIDDWRRLAERFERQIDQMKTGGGRVVSADSEPQLVVDETTHLRILRQELQEMSS